MPTIKKKCSRPWMVKREPFKRSRPNTGFYQSMAWRNLRKAFITQHPICEECKKKGIITPATVVDHIVPINEGGAALSPDNLQSLCDRCHNKKSASEGHKKNSYE